MTYQRSIGGYNRAPLNRDKYGSALYGRAESDSLTSGTAVAIRAFLLQSSASTIGSTDPVRTRILDTSNNVRGGFNTQPLNRDSLGNVLYCIGETDSLTQSVVSADIIFFITGPSKTISSTTITDAIYRVLTMTYSGAVAAGETVCIYGDKYVVTLDGSNSIQNFTGDFPRVAPGTNEFVYTDSETSRTVKIIIARRDRHV